MIGLKSASAIGVAAALVAIAAARGVLAPSYLGGMSGPACFLVGLVASLALALASIGWRFGTRSKSALAFAGKRLVLVEHAQGARELPAGVQRLLVLIGLFAIAAGAIGNHAAARIIGMPAALTEPSPSAYCIPKSLVELAAPAPPPPPPAAANAQAGCALVKRAYALGYTKSLGSCAPRTVAAALPQSPLARPPACTRRQLDEPYLHYAARRLAGAFGSVGETAPGDVVAKRIADTRAHLDHADDLMADVEHAITGSPHAAHHLWVSLPDPHPVSLRERFAGVPRCQTRFADLPLWPRWGAGDEARLVEHVLGQLLFANRFGTTTSCSDYTIHWNAPPDACAQLVAHPAEFLASQGALASVRAVLDRRRRQLGIAELDTKLGRTPPPPPPPAASLASFACLGIDHRGAPTGARVTVDGESIAVRELHVDAVRVTADGPIDVYLALAALLGGVDAPPARTGTGDVAFDRFALVRLDALVEADPFAGDRWPLARAELVDVFPFEHHLHAFVDAFRRRYLAQRGRL